jgi:uncharacterized protein (DUF433 family)
MMVETRYPHITLSEKQELLIEGTSMRLLQLIEEHKAWGWDAKALKENHPEFALGQIHATLAFYYDHATELDALLEAELAEFDQGYKQSKPLQNCLHQKIKTSVQGA